MRTHVTDIYKTIIERYKIQIMIYSATMLSDIISNITLLTILILDKNINYYHAICTLHR